MSNNTVVSVVIPNWNGADFILDCLSSIQNQTISCNIIVVENGSTDNSVELIESKFPKVKILKQSHNLGFAGGVNVGIRYALDNESSYIALLNNDAVAEKKWLESLVTCANNNPEVGIIASQMIQAESEKIDSAGECYSKWGFPYPRGRGNNAKRYQKQRHVFAASGGASLYRSTALRDVGLFDADFFAYYEDVDISFRMQLSGWKILYQPEAKVTHKVSATSSRHNGLAYTNATKNLNLLFYKNMPSFLLVKYLPLFLLRSLVLLLASILKGNFLYWIKGNLVFIRKLPSCMKKRKTIQKKRLVSIRYIESFLTDKFR